MRRSVLVWILATAVSTLGAVSAAAYQAVAVTDGGTLGGTVKLKGTPPAPAKVSVSKDPDVCGKEKTKPDLLVGSDGGLANAVVVVKASKGKKLEPAAQNPVLDQKACEFVPHVLAFPAGSTIDVLNSDGILHNLHTISTVNPATNQAQPKFKPKMQLKVEKPEWPIKVQCDAHSWMSAYWVSMDHPYYAVTGPDGSFKITDLPAGDYEVEIWHETLGKKVEKASVKAKEETKVGWEMTKS